jgi:hypothetical protein
MQYSSNVQTATSGPLSTSQTPRFVPNNNVGILTGKNANPPQYGDPNYATEFSGPRQQYLRSTSFGKSDAYLNNYNKNNQTPGTMTTYTNGFTGRKLVTHKNYIAAKTYNAPKDSSQITAIKKSQAVGQTSFKVGLKPNDPLGYKSQDKSFTRSAIRRVRSGGCTAPAKKGSIYNPSYTRVVGTACATSSGY